MNILITGIRIWIAIICIIPFFLLIPPLLIIETVAIFFSFPIFAILMSKAEIQKSWIGSYPNLPRKIFRSILKLWDWALDELDEPRIAKIILSAITGLFAFCLIISILTLPIIFLGENAIILMISIVIVVCVSFKFYKK
jgi:hypothetical protein